MKYIVFFLLALSFCFFSFTSANEEAPSENGVSESIPSSTMPSPPIIPSTNDQARPEEKPQKGLVPFTHMISDFFNKAKQNARSWTDTSLAYFG